MLFRSTLALSLASWAVSQMAGPARTDFRLATGGIELAATLTVPEGPGPHPAVLLLSGSGPSTRQNLEKFSDQINDVGFATLVFDKRGSGQSTGSWASASFDDSVRDAQAAIAWLTKDSRIDHRRIGIWGVSQAGWFIPAIVDRTPSLAFAIVLTGGGATPRDVEMFMHEAALDRANVSPEDRSKARQMLNAYFDWLGTGTSRQGVVDLIESARKELWYSAVTLDGVLPSDAGRHNWEWVATFDPMPLIERMTLPTLVVLGASDQMGSPDSAERRWRSGLTRAGNTRAQVVMIEGMGHAASIGSSHTEGGAVMPAYTAVVSRFLEAFRKDTPQRAE